MKQDKDDFKELFRSRLGDTGLTVKEGFWEELEKEMPSRRFFITNFNPIRFTATAAVLLLLVGTYAAFLLLAPQKEMEEAFQQVAFVPLTQDVISNDRVAEEFAPAVTVPVTRRQSTGIPAITTEAEDSISFNFSFSFSMTVEESSEHLTGEDHWYSYAGNGEEGAESGELIREHTWENGIKQNLSEPLKGWSVKVGANLFSPGYSSSLPGARMFTKSNSSLNLVKEWDGKVASSGEFRSNEAYEKYRNVIGVNEGKERTTKVKHRIPISVGLLVHKQLTNRFGLETGLTYTGLRSELNYGEGAYYTQDQKLHYLGIPLKTDVTFYEKESWSLYATAGALFEKCISGKIRTTYFEEALPVLKEEESVHPGRINYSLTAAAGVEYKVNDRLALYAEPGLSYSFDDNGAIATLRKDKPLNFNLQCGVRIQY